MKEYFDYKPDEVEALLALKNPLKYIADHWPSPVSELLDVDETIQERINEIPDEAEYPRRESLIDLQQGKVSVREQLQKTSQEAEQHKLYRKKIPRYRGPLKGGCSMYERPNYSPWGSLQKPAINCAPVYIR